MKEFFTSYNLNLTIYFAHLVHSCDDEVRLGVHNHMLQPCLVSGGTQRHRHVTRHPRGPHSHHVAHGARAEEADTCRRHVMAQEVLDSLG